VSDGGANEPKQGATGSAKQRTAWLIHDTRTPGFLTAAVLARRLSERYLCQSVAGTKVRMGTVGIVTERPTEFWEDCFSILIDHLGSGDRVYLCSITLHTLGDMNAIRETLERAREALGAEGCIVACSQRWPDRYSDVGVESWLVPLELTERETNKSDHFDRLMTELIFISSHQADPHQVAESDLNILDHLGTNLWSYYSKKEASCNERYDPAVDFFRSFLNEGEAMTLIEKWANSSSAGSPDWPVNVISHDEAYIIQIPVEDKVHRQGKLRKILRARTDNPFAIGVGYQVAGADPHRVLLLRREDVVVDRPSLWRLLQEDDIQNGWIMADENTLTLAPDRDTAGWAEGLNLEQILTTVQKWASNIAAKTTGDMGAPAVLSKVLCQAGDQALRDLDLGKKYSPQDLGFVAALTIVRFDSGNRIASDQIRRTLVLTLVVRTPNAAAFLMRGDGYVLSKLEMLLEGVLLGLRAARNAWLWSVRLVQRIRINVEFDFAIDAPALQSMAKALKRDVEALPMINVHSDSVIGRALTQAKSKTVIAFRETEMIGPSVQYGRTAASLVAELGHREESLQILDLFSGSGFSTWALKRARPEATVICVDASVNIRDSLVKGSRDVLWLRATVEELLGARGREGILSHSFDLVILDPPHAALLGMLFGGLIRTLAKRTKWLVIYQGHTSQSGRGRAALSAIKGFFRDRQIATIVVDSEEIVVCGPDEWETNEGMRTFETILESVGRALTTQGHSVRSDTVGK
jgi:16S rRNA G966 N2-methylase RsmD